MNVELLVQTHETHADIEACPLDISRFDAVNCGLGSIDPDASKLINNLDFSQS